MDIDWQAHIANSLPSFTIVKLPDKAVGERWKRVRTALGVLGLTLPTQPIMVNLSPTGVRRKEAIST